MVESTFHFHFRECTNPECLFRYPVTEEKVDLPDCPRCGSPAPVCASVNHVSPIIDLPLIFESPKIILVLDNLRSVFNVGSIFRSSDGTGIVKEIILCGTTPTPQHPKFQKTALGSQQSIPWRYTTNALETCVQLRNQSTPLWSLEITEHSKNLLAISASDIPSQGNDIALIVGNEVAGIDPAILKISDAIFHLPLNGIKESLNVAIACSIAIYYLYHQFTLVSK